LLATLITFEIVKIVEKYFLSSRLDSVLFQNRSLEKKLKQNFDDDDSDKSRAKEILFLQLLSIYTILDIFRF